MKAKHVGGSVDLSTWNLLGGCGAEKIEATLSGAISDVLMRELVSLSGVVVELDELSGEFGISVSLPLGAQDFEDIVFFLPMRDIVGAYVEICGNDASLDAAADALEAAAGQLRAFRRARAVA